MVYHQGSLYCLAVLIVIYPGGRASGSRRVQQGSAQTTKILKFIADIFKTQQMRNKEIEKDP